MTCYARKVEYAAHDGDCGASYVALIEFCRKNGCRDGVIIRRVLYLMRLDFAKRQFKYWLCEVPCNGGFTDFWIDGSKFVGWDSTLWTPTSRWLDHVAAGGWYQCFKPGTWVKVGRPRKRRIKKIRRVNPLVELRGNISQIKIEISGLEDERYGLVYDGYHPAETIDEIDVTLEKLRVELAEATSRLTGIIDELRFVYARKLGVPYWPRSTETLRVEPLKVSKKRNGSTKA